MQDIDIASAKTAENSECWILHKKVEIAVCVTQYNGRDRRNSLCEKALTFHTASKVSKTSTELHIAS